MKRFLSLALACVMSLTLLAACGPKEEPAADVDLAAFAETVMSEHEFGFLELADDEITEYAYPGLTAIETKQAQVYVCMMSMNNGEFVLAETTSAEDAQAVADILQARVDTMAQGGAFYPEATEMWTQNSAVVSNGNFVMMVVHEDKDAIVEDFNGLF